MMRNTPQPCIVRGYRMWVKRNLWRVNGQSLRARCYRDERFRLIARITRQSITDAERKAGSGSERMLTSTCSCI